MRIAINPQINTNPPSFTSNGRETGKKEDGTLNRNSTEFFRDDMDWENFPTLLSDKYKAEDKVNIYCYACSDGSEPFSIAMLLISRFGKEGARKFLPIIAVDNDDYYLEEARKGRVKISGCDAGVIADNTDGNYKNYINIDFDDDETIDDLPCCSAKVKNFIRDAVVFKQGDIRKDISKLHKKNTVLMFRNACEYMDVKDRKDLAKKIKDNLGKNSMLIMGEVDKNSYVGMPKVLFEQGFVNVDSNDDFRNSYIHPSFTGSNFLNNPQYLQSVFIKSR